MNTKAPIKCKHETTQVHMTDSQMEQMRQEEEDERVMNN